MTRQRTPILSSIHLRRHLDKGGRANSLAPLSALTGGILRARYQFREWGWGFGITSRRAENLHRCRLKNAQNQINQLKETT